MVQQELEAAFQKLGITLSIGTVEKCLVGLCTFPAQKGIEHILKKAGGYWSQKLQSWYISAEKAVLLRVLKAVSRHLEIPVEREEIQALRAALMAQGYSNKTTSNYLSSFGQALDYLYPRQPADWSKAELESFLAHLTRQGLGGNAQNGMVNALLFYGKTVLQRPVETYLLPRAKKPQGSLPVFSTVEVRTILLSLENAKHRAMLVLCYSCGLRVGEVVALQATDINLTKMTLRVPAGKGRKSREVPLSQTALRCLQLYKAEKQEDGDFLFAGKTRGHACSVRSVQEAFQQAKAKAGIVGEGCMQALRHSYAVHLLDRGTDVSLVQQLLGHQNRKTMTRYLHLSTSALDRVVSPVEAMGI